MKHTSLVLSESMRDSSRICRRLVDAYIEAVEAGDFERAAELRTKLEVVVRRMDATADHVRQLMASLSIPDELRTSYAELLVQVARMSSFFGPRPNKSDRFWAGCSYLLVPRKHREAIMGDILQDRSELRQAGWSEWFVNVQTAINLLDASWRRPWLMRFGLWLTGGATVLARFLLKS